jgi:hypothetical protein
MRLTTTRLAVPLIMLVLAGCGGEQVVVNNVPGGPVDLKTPGTGEGFAAAKATATPTATPSGTPTDDQAQTSETPAGGTTSEAPTDTGTQTDPNSGGAAEAPATEDGGGTGEAPDPGAGKQEFEDYCAQNPGAC